MSGIVSVYATFGNAEEADEVAAIFKTTTGNAPLLLQRIAALHSYEVPAAVVWPVEQTGESYRQWVIANSGR